MSDGIKLSDHQIEAAIAEVKRVTRIADEIGMGDRWKGRDFTNQQEEYDPTPVDEAIATILNAVVSGRLVPATPSLATDTAERTARALLDNSTAGEGQ
ncbi:MULTISPECIES: hypothetical protein [unclassified Paracoccus (in: a-proteobacteria)]|uniref:hypothetical protein n=1 Tax=unclassified Paracoccus (in: a-proteobacteria) TaxID=2688777 RepID=UPI0012B2E3ED|nr:MULTISPECIES: hypothetical protein [unclassified Paracoccus (in: a-proteobacteria)]UXU73845.1 hypothetical protein GB879_007815 [Paracoccus sp. SMMA_5]UXU79733.1 hypothetical protein GB880_007795 [Paracoccus sp. SMMA_5_TC]